MTFVNKLKAFFHFTAGKIRFAHILKFFSKNAKVLEKPADIIIEA